MGYSRVNVPCLREGRRYGCVWGYLRYTCLHRKKLAINVMKPFMKCLYVASAAVSKTTMKSLCCTFMLSGVLCRTLSMNRFEHSRVCSLTVLRESSKNICL